jgi:hypothetical protein
MVLNTKRVEIISSGVNGEMQLTFTEDHGEFIVVNIDSTIIVDIDLEFKKLNNLTNTLNYKH